MIKPDEENDQLKQQGSVAPVVTVGNIQSGGKVDTVIKDSAIDSCSKMQEEIKETHVGIVGERAQANTSPGSPPALNVLHESVNKAVNKNKNSKELGEKKKDKTKKSKKSKKNSKDVKKLQLENKKLKAKVHELQIQVEKYQALIEQETAEAQKYKKLNDDLQNKVISKMDEYGKNPYII